ncbi:MAG: pyruvate dehydrogenase (acetyl-transferring) E1 component subunit alpha [Planctomycetota bacterium]|jgi:pyruvate dehydrogenase E1 component alpha subunit
MPARTVLDARIEHVSILDQDGNFDAELGKGLIPDKDAVRIYEQMQISRRFDEVALKLQREGRMGTYPENCGQEAVSLGAVYALRPDDWFVPCYRENAGIFLRGYKPEWVLLHWMGDERGNLIDRDLWVTAPSTSIGGHTPHAVGLAWACQYRKEDRVVCTVFGDGASSQGDCHEACNFAASFHLPVIFICQNNGWAISVPTKIQCAAPTVAQRGLAYGMECVQADGNDVFAMARVVKDAAERARKGGPPTFIEAITYRLGDHTTSDDARRYRDPAELEMWKKRDPLIRLRKYLTERKLWDDKKQETLEARAKKEVASAVERAEGITPAQTDDLFDWLFAEPFPDLEIQRDTLRTAILGQDPSQLPHGAVEAPARNRTQAPDS